MSRRPDTLTRLSVAIRYEQISRSVLDLRSIHGDMKLTVQQLQQLRKLVLLAEHSHKARDPASSSTTITTVRCAIMSAPSSSGAILPPG